LRLEWRKMKKIVELKDVYKSFDGVIAMKGMSFSMEEGEVRCLIGENGCGKSTMIKVISGFHPFDRGQLFINGKEFKTITPLQAMNEGIQVIYQDFSLFSNMTIAENIMMYDAQAKNRKFVNWKAMRAKAQETIDRIKFDIDIDKYVYELNVAQKQMVAICRAIVRDAKLLIMDEPTTALTNTEVEKLFSVVSDLKAQGVSVLFVSHKLDEVLKISDSITVMRNGQNVYESKGERPSKEELIYYMTGKKLSEERFHYVKADDKPLMEVKNYSLKGSFEDINFSLYKGEVLGIAGLLGCGKNELAKALFGITPATSGEVIIDGESIGLIKNVQQALKYDIGYVPEDRLTEGLHMEQTIADNAVSRVIRSLIGKFGLLDKKKVGDQKKESLSMIHIAGMKPSNPVKSLSGGNQQKVVIVKWLAANPRILILNSPTVGVDVGAKSEIHKIVKDLARNGMGVIVISDDIPEVIQICNRVLIMKDGVIAGESLIEDTTTEKLEAQIALGANETVDAI
jgi:simple sugar transport system ATP-binding protein